MNFFRTTFVTAAVILLPCLGQAASISNAGTLNVGNYSFSDFNCRFSSAGTSTPGSCGAINVNTITQPGTGIQFSSGFSSYGSGSLADAVVAYVINSSSAISSVGLSFDGNFYGQAIASVTETIWNNGSEIGYASVACGAGQAGCRREDNIALNGNYNSFYVEKDIQLASYSDGSGAFASIVDQTFADAKTPEPSSLALLGGGLVGVAGMLKRRRKALVKS